MNVIFGTGGFAREVDWLLFDLYQAERADFRADAFVTEDGGNLAGTTLKGRPVFAESEFIAARAGSDVNCFLALGQPQVRARCAERLLHVPGFNFPSVMHPTVVTDTREGAVRIAEGTIVCAGSIITTDVTIGRFVHVNLDCTIGHDAVIGDFSTLSPGVHVSGNVRFDAEVYAGTGAAFIERIAVVRGAVIGAGAVVRESIREAGTYVGVPARRLNR